MFRTPRSHREAGGLPLLLVTVWLGVWIQQISCQESGADVIHARAESTVILPAPEVMKPVEFTWYRGDMVLRQMISSYTVSPPRQSNGPRYTGRETVLPDGSLEIRILIPSDSSNYLLQVKTDNGSVTRLYTRHLLVYYGEASHDNPNVNQEPAMDYENLRPRNHGDSLVQTSDMDSPYMELKHGDKAIYGILKR
ncbi:pregnancy-specific beta-1-glycoprotein 3-like isoform X5 [Ambystoma mexicanum]|uniref:pregnancy-specific beta-1-glycoprotein 3-like isoform X5 n=1 Tax=Ambystoma mexicanum TaxID=8296 RepID=UPI0037E8897B